MAHSARGRRQKLPKDMGPGALLIVHDAPEHADSAGPAPLTPTHRQPERECALRRARPCTTPVSGTGHRPLAENNGPVRQTGYEGIFLVTVRRQLQHSIHRQKPYPETSAWQTHRCAGEPDHAAELAETTIRKAEEQ